MVAISFGAGFVAGSVSAAAFFQRKVQSMQKQLEVAKEEAEKEHLHWDENREIRGLGDLLHKVNHLAIIVKDVGRSLTWYSDVVGFQQIRRPNFDRHGAWLTMGNIELHLIKGKPHTKRGQHPDDLIVSHIALEVKDADAVLQRLQNLKENVRFEDIEWRQNVSVPTPAASRAEKFESEHTDSKGKVTQFFLEDPDGYWIEICNCSVLTDFCLGKDDAEHLNYAEGMAPKMELMRTVGDLHHWVNFAKQRALKHGKSQNFSSIPEEEVDESKLENLACRCNTYGDICQGFSKQELRTILAQAGNDVPKAIVLLETIRDGQHERVLMPPKFLDNSDTVHTTQAIHMEHEQPVLLGRT